MPRVWNKRERAVPHDAVYVGRPSPWGNDFKIGRDGTREEVVAKYRLWLEADDGTFRAAIRKHLRGKDLVCWCAPLPCHADVLLEIANAEPPPRSRDDPNWKERNRRHTHLRLRER